MTVRVTTLKGAEAGAYYVEQLPSYYLQAGEPRGVWHGIAAGELGLSGEVGDDDFLALMAGMDPGDPERDLGRAYDEESVRGFDVTASAPKSVSVLWALGDENTRHQVVAAHDAAVTAMAAWIERHAHTRFRIAGEVAIVDAEGIVAAAFRQHTSRALDPQLHTHLVIANRVKSPDGRWLALDARTIKRDQRTLSGIYHAGLRAELTARLGVRWHEPTNGIAEIADIPASLVIEFSSRTNDVQRRLEEKLDRFTATFDRAPTPRERWRLEREAVLDSRPAKAHQLDAGELHRTWHGQIEQLGLDPAAVVAGAVDQVRRQPTLEAADRERMLGFGIGELVEKQSTWRPAEIVRELAAVVPTDTAVTAESLVELLDDLGDRATVELCVDVSRPIPPGARLRRDGRPVSEASTDRALTTQQILDEEAWLVGWTERRLAHHATGSLEAIHHSRVRLSPAQAEAAAAVAGDGDVVLIVGPAGTGKTTALAPAVEQLRADGRAVFGVAPSATAAEVLADSTGVSADTIHKLLIEHSLNRPPDHRFNLPCGTTVLVDEAGMLGTRQLLDLTELADLKGWRLALVGDPLQFSAVGRGGMFGLLVDTFGAVELDRVHRFDHDWERNASLLLRRGDPQAAEIYNEHGRLHGGTPEQMQHEILTMWWQLRRQGQPVLMMTPSREAVELLNRRAQQLLIRAGELDHDGRHVAAGPYQLHVRDEIATRQNDRRLRSDRGEMVRNRAVWTIDAIHRDGSVTATGADGTVHLPAEYVQHHLELAYARTGMAGQGRNVQVGLGYYDGSTDVRNVYVPLTRGTSENHAFIVTREEETALDVFTRYVTSDWIDQTAHTRQAELHNRDLHRPGLLNPHELRGMLERLHEIHTTLDNAERVLRQLPDEITRTERHRAELEQRVTQTMRRYESALETIDRCDKPLRRRRHEHELADAHQDITRLPAELDRCRREHTATESRLAQLRQAHAQAVSILRNRPDLAREVSDIDRQLTADRHVRARITRHERTPNIINVIGQAPPGGPDAQRWDRAAGLLAQQHAAYGAPVDQLAHHLGIAPRVAQSRHPVPEIELPGLSL